MHVGTPVKSRASIRVHVFEPPLQDSWLRQCICMMVWQMHERFVRQDSPPPPPPPVMIFFVYMYIKNPIAIFLVTPMHYVYELRHLIPGPRYTSIAKIILLFYPPPPPNHLYSVYNVTQLFPEPFFFRFPHIIMNSNIRHESGWKSSQPPHCIRPNIYIHSYMAQQSREGQK